MPIAYVRMGSRRDHVHPEIQVVVCAVHSLLGIRRCMLGESAEAAFERQYRSEATIIASCSLSFGCIHVVPAPRGRSLTTYVTA
jgi:hypothetical protein